MKSTIDSNKSPNIMHFEGSLEERYNYARLASKTCIYVSMVVGITVFAVAKVGYEIKEDKSGRTIRIDKWTGNISILDGETLIEPETGEQQKAREEESRKKEKDELSMLSDEHIWTSQEIPKIPSVKLYLSTTWREGNLCFKLRLQPLSPKFQQLRDAYGTSNWFILRFLDKHGFTLLTSDKISLSELTPEVDAKGKADALSYEGNIPCGHSQGLYLVANSKAKYLDIASWTFSYSLSDYSSLDVPIPPPPAAVSE